MRGVADGRKIFVDSSHCLDPLDGPLGSLRAIRVSELDIT
jgi:hypothetical protein